MAQKVYIKTVILAAIAAQITAIKAAFASSVEGLTRPLEELTGPFLAKLRESGLTEMPKPATLNFKVPDRDYLVALEARKIEIEALASVEGQDGVLLEEGEAKLYLNPEGFPSTTRTITVHVG